MKRSQVFGVVGATALVVGTAIGGPSAVAAINGSSAHKPVVRPVSTESIVSSAPVTIAAGSNGIAQVTCTVGKVTGGGGTTSGFDIFFTDSAPSGGKTWYVRGTNKGTTDQTLTAWAVCK